MSISDMKVTAQTRIGHRHLDTAIRSHEQRRATAGGPSGRR